MKDLLLFKEVVVAVRQVSGELAVNVGNNIRLTRVVLAPSAPPGEYSIINRSYSISSINVLKRHNYGPRSYATAALVGKTAPKY